MDLTLTRNEKIFLSLCAAAVGVFLIAFQRISAPQTNSQFETREAINYEMARPEEGFTGYSLDDREIDDEYFATGATGKRVPLAKNMAKGSKAQGVDKKAQANKSNTAKKTAEAPAQAVKQTQKSEQKTAPADAATKSVKNEANSNSQNPSEQLPTVVNANSAAPDSADQKDPNEKPPKNKKSYSQWREELLARPTKETMSAFITAYRKNEITTSEFQAMAQDLIDQADVKLKGLGLMALRAQPSLESLSQLVHAQEKLPADLQAYVEQAYLAYIHPQHINVFVQALHTKDKKLVVKALTILNTNILKIKNGDTANYVDPRLRREGTVQALTTNAFAGLLPSLAQVASAGDPEVSGLAGQVAGLIQTGSSVAGL